MPRLKREKLLVVGWCLLTAALLCWILVRLADWGMCSYYGYQTERDTRYAAFMGCLVNVNGRWYPRDEIRVLQ